MAVSPSRSMGDTAAPKLQLRRAGVEIQCYFSICCEAWVDKDMYRHLPLGQQGCFKTVAKRPLCQITEPF